VRFENGFGFRSIYKEVASPALWVSCAFTSIVVAWAGPFGTFGAQPFVWRLVYWSVLIFAATILGICLRGFWRNRLGGDTELLEDLAVSGSLSLIFGPAVTVLNRELADPQFLTELGTIEAIVCVFLISIATVAVRRAASTTKSEVVKEAKPDRLLNRISAKPGARLVRVCSDNHHIRLKTDDGEEYRILMRLRDAVGEIDQEEGIIVHRSHWVSVDAVVGVKTCKKRTVVVLRDGTEVPVGPSYRENLAFAEKITA